MAVSPSGTGRYVAYFARGHWWVLDTAGGSHRDVADAPGLSFEADLAMVGKFGEPAAGVAWLAGDHDLIAHDAYDAWLLHPDGSEPRRLTRGRERGRVYRLVGAGVLPDVPGGPFYFHVVEARSKQAGYARVGADGEEAIITLGPWAIGELAKARDAERFAFRRESYDVPPNYVTADARGGDPRPMTDLKAEAGSAPQPRRELISFRDRRGAELHGVLIHPVEYDPEKTYPMVVLIYEIVSDGYYRFRSRDWSAGEFPDDPMAYASRGYFVLLPDIIPRLREDGVSAVDCVEAAVREALRRARVDPRRIGLMGGSHGGYRTAFILSKSKLFAAGVAESPVVDPAHALLTDRLGSLAGYEWSRARGMTVPSWEDPESSLATSVIYQARGITSPLLIGVGRLDQVVDSREGEALFNLLRFLRRPAYLAVYPRGSHSLGEDFRRRARGFFDHHLRGDPAPERLGDTRP